MVAPCRGCLPSRGQGLDRNVDELRTGCGDAETWEQEYELKWLDEPSAWLSLALITADEHGEGARRPATAADREQAKTKAGEAATTLEDVEAA